ncbi:predicted protein [Brucella sp. 83/13]|nr:predicted protein [Brucella sp. 83/13]
MLQSEPQGRELSSPSGEFSRGGIVQKGRIAMRHFPVAFARCYMKRDVKWFSDGLRKKRMRASLAIMIGLLRARLRHLVGQGACLVNTGCNCSVRKFCRKQYLWSGFLNRIALC